MSSGIANCHDCRRPAHLPQPWETFTGRHRKVSGWVGDKWIPSGFKSPKIKRMILCGVCYALRETANLKQARGEDVTVGEMERELLKLAQNETALRSEKSKGRTPRRVTSKKTVSHSPREYNAYNVEWLTDLLTCGCRPGEDVKTFGMWLREGRAVAKGQQALILPAGGACVWCRCQTTVAKGKVTA